MNTPEDTDRKQIWQDILKFMEDRFGKKPNMDAMLFIIGMRELGHLYETNFKKDDKVSLMHIATCKILSYSDHYQLVGTDKDGWPHWQLINPLPDMELLEQETYIREHIIEYFINEQIL
ncbi:MAG: hypothetical protein R2852_09250 [Bacteroidia bacterium]